MDNSSFKFSRTNSNSIDKYTCTNKNNISNTINEIEIQVRPSTSKSSLDYSNINNTKNDNLCLNYANESLESKYNINKSNILGENRHFSCRRVIPSMVKPEFLRKKEKLLNNGNISLSVHSIVANEIKDMKKQNLCRKLGDSIVQNVNTNLSLVPRDINHKPKPVKLLSIPLSDTNKTCLSNHNLNSHRITAQPLERALQATTNIQNQGTFPESLTLKKLQLAARAEQLRIAEEIVQKKEEEADAIEWQAIQEREATLFEKERLLEAREKAAEKKYDEAVKSIEKCRYEMLELNESKSDPANSLNNSFISNVSSNQNTFHIQQQYHPENVIKSGEPCKILPYNNILSKSTGKPSIRKQKKSFHALDLCKIEPRLELSSLKHTYSRKSPKKRFEETKSNNFDSHFSQPHNLKFSQTNIDLPGSSRTMNEQTLISDSGTITITQLPKFDQPLRPFSAFPRLSSLCSKDKSEIRHSSSPVLSRMENCPSRISINYSPCSSSSETSLSITEKVEKLTSDLQFHSLTMDKEQEGYTSVREHDIKPKIIDFSQNASCQSNEKIIKPVADQIKYLRNYDNNENSKKMFLQIAPHCYTINTDYSIPGTCETNVDVSNIKASYKLSASICDSRRSKSFEDKTTKCRDYTAESLHYQSLNYESSVNNFTENSENQTVPLISKVDVLERQDKDKVISDNELDFYNCNLNVKPRNEGNCNTVRMTQESRSLLPKQGMGIKNITLPSGHKNSSVSHFVFNDCKRSNFEKIIASDKDIHSEIFTNNCVQIVKVLPCSQFISVEDRHNKKYENDIDTSVQSPEADFIQIKYHTSNDSLQVTSLLSNDEQISTDIQNGELDCFEKNEKSSKSYEITSDVLNVVHETFPPAAFRNEEELNESSSESNVTSCDKRISNINNVEIQNISLENVSVSHVMECDEVQTFPLDLGIEKEFNHATISDNTCAKNIKSEDNLVCSKQEVISPTNFDTPCIVSANQEFYLSPNLIYTSQSQELLPSCDISYSSNYNNEICSNELIYAGSHLESDVKHLNLNSTHLQGNSDEPPEKQSSSDFSLAKTPIENYDPSLKNMTLLDCSTNKCSNFKNSDLEFNTESLNSSALFPTDGQKSFNLLSSTFIENCEDNSNDTNFSSESFQEPNSQSSSIEATNLKENYMDVTKEDSLYFCNNNNNNIDNVMSRGGRILKMKRWWNTDADAETVKSDDRKDQIISDYQNSFVDNDSNSLKESNLKPRKKRGRKKGVKRMIMEENSENNERPHWKQCIWIANIIPSAMRNNNSLECGKCAKVFSSVQTFKSHAYSSHNGLVRLKGDSQEFDEPLLNEILSIVFKVKKKLICSECKKSFKSLVGYKYHSERCGKTEADFYSFCKICNKKLLSTSIETHEKNHDNKIRLKAEKKLLEMKRKNLENDDDLEKSVGRTPRKAAKYCHDQMKLLYGSIDSEYDDSADKDFIEEEVDKYFYSNEFKSPDKSHKFDEFNKNILKFGESKCLTIGCDLIFKDIKQLKLHLRTCSSHYVTCKLCLSTIKRININEHLEECRKDDASNDSDDLSDVDEHDSVIDSCKTSKVLTVRFKQYQYSKEMTKQFRKINYSDRLYTTLICHSIDWIAVNDDDLYLYQSRLPHSPLFSLLKNSSDKDISWEKIQNLKGNVLDSSEIFFAGGSIRSVAWCPIPVMNNEPSQYIAVSCTNNPDQSCPINKSEKHNGLLQIWHCGNLTKPEIPELSLGIAHENGVIWSMEWCPSGIYEDPYANSLEDSVIKRLGLLAAAFSDGIIRVYLIPHPYQIASKNKIFKKNPEFSLCPYDYENLDLQCVKVSWCASKNHSLIAGSFTNGMVCIWNLNCTSTLLSFQDSEGGTKLYPINSISAHNGVCSAVSFFPKTEGRHIVTGGYDRTIKFWDLMQPEHPLNVIKKGIVTDSVWLPHWAGAFFSFDDAYSLGKTTTTFRENGFYGSTFRSVLGTNATVWSISGSDWLNAIVQADEAGEVILSLQHNLNCEIQGEKHMSKKRFPLFSAKIEKVKNEKIFCDESSQLSNEKTSFENNIPQTYNDTNESSPELFMEQPLTYAASMENYGIKFYDEDYQDPSKLDEISIRSKQCSELMEPGPLTQYPLMGGSSVSWNNNYGTHTWICVGFHSGLVRIVQIPRLE